MNVTVVTPSGGGYTTVYPYGASQPLAASINYTTGAIVNNTVIVRIPSPLTIKDFTVYTFAKADYVADIVGYFSPPEATTLDCVGTTVQSSTIVAGGTVFQQSCLPGRIQGDDPLLLDRICRCLQPGQWFQREFGGQSDLLFVAEHHRIQSNGVWR